ncbi:MAG TPA: hypothetical protein DGG95_03275 [Cytophagales bacterium]|nr:hypothetical protein [Cytophagales bacterium]
MAAFGAFAQPIAEDEIMDARRAKLNEVAFALNGTCQYFENQLLTPAECKSAIGMKIKFPELFQASEKEEGIGFATYVLTILIPKGEKDLALSLPQMYSSYRLWANGKVIAENGVVGKTIDECKPQWRPQTVSFQIQSDTLSLVLQIANFHHAKGGIKESIYLGKPSLMNFKRSVAVISKSVESLALFLIGIFFLFIYLVRHRDKATIYFSLLALTWAVRSVFSNIYLFISYFPDFNWNAMVRIEYLTLYLTMIWAILFLTNLFTRETNLLIKYALVLSNALFILFTVSSEPRIFTQGLKIYLVASGVLLAYGAYVIIHAWLNERVGSGLLTITIVLGLNIFGYDIFVYQGFSSYDPVIFSAGYVVIFSLMGIALASYVSMIKTKPSKSSSLSYEDLYKNN